MAAAAPDPLGAMSVAEWLNVALGLLALLSGVVFYKLGRRVERRKSTNDSIGAACSSLVARVEDYVRSAADFLGGPRPAEGSSALAFRRLSIESGFLRRDAYHIERLCAKAGRSIELTTNVLKMRRAVTAKSWPDDPAAASLVVETEGNALCVLLRRAERQCSDAS